MSWKKQKTRKSVGDTLGSILSLQLSCTSVTEQEQKGMNIGVSNKCLPVQSLTISLKEWVQTEDCDTSHVHHATSQLTKVPKRKDYTGPLQEDCMGGTFQHGWENRVAEVMRGRIGYSRWRTKLLQPSVKFWCLQALFEVSSGAYLERITGRSSGNSERHSKSASISSEVSSLLTRTGRSGLKAVVKRKERRHRRDDKEGQGENEGE
jgi:hypothetical protein